MLDLHSAAIHHGIHHFARRAVITLNGESHRSEGVAVGDARIDIPFPASTILFTTIILSVVALALARYSLQGVITTLAIVEEPTAPLLIESFASSKDNSELLEPLIDEKAKDVEVVAVKQAPITTSIRRTVQHLRRQGGWRAPFRGMAPIMVHGLCAGFIRHVTALTMPWMAATFVSHILAAVLLARLHMAWTHAIISAPSTEPWYRHLPASNTWRKIAKPAAFNAIMFNASIAFPMGLAMVYFPDMSREGMQAAMQDNPQATIIKLGGLLVTTVSVMIYWYLPSYISLIRIEASMLPESVETIVPFDRTFGGKVMVDSMDFFPLWNASFDTFKGKARLAKLFVKIGLIEVLLHVAFASLIAGEIATLIPRESLNKFVQMIAQQHEHA